MKAYDDKFGIGCLSLQDLTFCAAERIFAECNVKRFEVLQELQNLSSGEYTNPEFLLSDQCTYTTKVAVFNDEENIIVKETREFKGSVISQFEETFAFLKECTHISEGTDYPKEVLHEALVNAIVHRDYRYSGSIIINLNNTRLEFINLGGLPDGMTLENIMEGSAKARNENLAHIFQQLHFMANAGTGIPNICSLYKKCADQPRIEVTPHTFKLILPKQKKLDHFGKCCR